MALALPRPRRKADPTPPPASTLAEVAPEQAPQPAGEIGALRAQRAALLEEAGGIEQRIATAQAQAQRLRAVALDDRADPGEQARAQAELDGLTKVIARDANRAQGLLARVAPLDAQIEDREQRRKQLHATRVRDVALLDRKAEMAQDLQPIYAELRAVEAKYRRALPQSSELLQQAALSINKPLSDVDQLRQRIGAIDAELQRLGE
jgi:hypothetical protein